MTPASPRRTPSRRTALAGLVAALVAGHALAAPPLAAQAPNEARLRWERLCQIRREKFDRILPEAMRENGIDMWIVAMKEGHYDPQWELLGRGYVGDVGYYVFTDRGGDRIERAVLGIDDHHVKACGAYDLPDAPNDLPAFVRARNPRSIGLNMSEEIGRADGLTHTLYLHIVKTLGPDYASRIVSAEKLVSDFTSRRVASEIVAFGEAGEMGRQLLERALSNEVITPGRTTLADVSWWLEEQMQQRRLGTSFEVPSVYITGPGGVEATSTDRVIQRGDLVMIDYGVGYLGMWTDQKRIAYVLREGETQAPPWLQRAFDQALAIRDIIHRTLKPGKTAQETLALLEAAIAKGGFRKAAAFNRIAGDDATEFFIGCHSVGDWGHGLGPSIAFFNPRRLLFEVKPTNLFSIELFAWVPADAWGGKKVRIPLEDDAIVTSRGVEWLYPVNQRLRLVR
ncbi:MAG: aminopeptidase P family protein [Gemmatimonadetes bacterium]|nr:aminopeptidase P family protein [Gemmatimonadota bacterium]